MILVLAGIAQRQGGDLTWLEPYWPAIELWYKFLVTLLPFPQEQLRCVPAPPPPPPRPLTHTPRGLPRAARASSPRCPVVDIPVTLQHGRL